MVKLLTAAQMRAIEMAAIESGGVTGLMLMERAGTGVVEAIFERWPEFDLRGRGASPSGSLEYLEQNEKGVRAAVFCGPGNNGGDGFVVARLLRERGLIVDVFLYGDPETLPPDARVNYELWCDLGDVAQADHLDGWSGCTYDLVIDALFGTGLTRPLTAKLARLRRFLYANPLGKIVAIDAVSGIDLDSGQALFEASDEEQMDVDLVVSFHKFKVGHFIGPHAQHVEELALCDIGLDRFDPGTDQVSLVDLHQEDYGLDKGRRLTSAHKFSHGHAFVLSGGAGRTGAARLAARGALRIGAGLVTLGVPPAALQEVAAQVTAVMVQPIADATALEGALQDSRITALCLGPGLGIARAQSLVPIALVGKEKAAPVHPTVLDADALTAFAEAPEVLFDMLHQDCVLTPHGGEFARLFPDIAEKHAGKATRGPAYSKVDATREAAARAGCVVLFKGADTVIAAPDGRCSVNAAFRDCAAPWLATAGAGDVLAGFITGLLARGFDPFLAAEAGAWLHVDSARQFGPGLIAEDLPEQLPGVFRTLCS